MDAAVILDSLPQLAMGAWLTAKLTILALALATGLAVPLAFARRHAVWCWPLAVYSYVIRGTPLLVQVFIVYYGLGQIAALRASVLWVVLRDAYWCALLALTINATAYLMEVFGGAIAAVPTGEIEGAKALGLSSLQRIRLIVLPRAARAVLPSYGNEIILLLKATSLASTITLLDLTGVARNLVASTYAPYEIFLAAALFYLSMSLLVVWLFQTLERRWHIASR